MAAKIDLMIYGLLFAIAYVGIFAFAIPAAINGLMRKQRLKRRGPRKRRTLEEWGGDDYKIY
jgi:hypothetical protein